MVELKITVSLFKLK